MDKLRGFVSTLHGFNVLVSAFDSMLFLAMLGNTVFSHILVVAIP
jgi:hypothetical protein